MLQSDVVLRYAFRYVAWYSTRSQFLLVYTSTDFLFSLDNSVAYTRKDVSIIGVEDCFGLTWRQGKNKEDTFHHD